VRPHDRMAAAMLHRRNNCKPSRSPDAKSMRTLFRNLSCQPGSPGPPPANGVEVPRPRLLTLRQNGGLVADRAQMSLASKGTRIAHSCWRCRAAKKHSLMAALRLNEVDVRQQTVPVRNGAQRLSFFGRLHCGLASPHSPRRESSDKCQPALSASSIRCRHVHR
jgi:hypothetical protein